MANIFLQSHNFKVMQLNQIQTENCDNIVVVTDKTTLKYIAEWLDPNDDGFFQNCNEANDQAIINLDWNPLFPKVKIQVMVLNESKVRTHHQWKKLTTKICNTIIQSKAKRTALIAPALSKAGIDNLYLQLGLELESRSYTYIAPYHTEEAKKKKQVESVDLYIDENPDQLSLEQGQMIGEGMNSSKLLGDLPSNICDPAYIQNFVEKISEKYDNITLDILDEYALEKEGMHSFLSVGKGSEKASRLVCIEYKNSNDAPLALIGKGITFDTGGISLKPGASMDEMKYDMCGAASVVGTIQAIASMQLPVHVVGLLALAENMPSGNASKPGDVVVSKSGKTIEILNTDAEGRLVLCDTITYSKKYNPKWVVDIATLTGACVIALGHELTAVYCEDDDLRTSLLESGEKLGDRGWSMPLHEEYDRLIKSRFADMQNIGGRSAGSITAAMFLKRFATDMKWAHLDIAGTAWNSGGKKEATGRPVPMLTKLCMQLTDD